MGHGSWAVLVSTLCALGGGLFLQTPATGTGVIVGQVVETPSGRGVNGTTVTLINRTPGSRGSPAPPVIADSQGRFYFGSLPAGTYATQVFKPGYSVTSLNAFNRLIDLADGERITDLKVRLIKLATINGTVRDDAGDPVVGTTMIGLLRSIVNGRPTWQSTTQVRTDDRGMYRLANLRPGEYLVCACARDPIPFDSTLLTTLAAQPLQLMGVAARALQSGADAASLDSTLRTFAPTLYPNSLTTGRATRVMLTSGEEKSGIDIEVTAVRATRVSGVIVGAPNPIYASFVQLRAAGETENAVGLPALNPILVQPDGRFDFVGVPAGQYVLRVMHSITSERGGGPSGAALSFIGARADSIRPSGVNVAQVDEPPLFAFEPIAVGDDGITGLTITLRWGPKISGRLQFSGAAPQPTPQNVQRAVVIAENLNLDQSRSGVSGLGRVTADATFEVRGVQPGSFVFRTLNPIPGWTMKSIAIGAVDVTDLPLDIRSEDLTNVVVTFTDARMPTATGTLNVPPGSDELSVVAFPVDRRYWVSPSASSRRFRSAPINRKGAFTLQDVPAGEYFMLVVPDEALANWQDVSRLETLSRSAQRVTFADGEQKTVVLRR